MLNSERLVKSLAANSVDLPLTSVVSLVVWWTLDALTRLEVETCFALCSLTVLTRQSPAFVVLFSVSTDFVLRTWGRVVTMVTWCFLEISYISYFSCY